MTGMSIDTPFLKLSKKQKQQRLLWRKRLKRVRARVKAENAARRAATPERKP